MTQRKFSHQKFFILLLITMRINLQWDRQSFQQYFESDLHYCSECFQQQISECSQFLSTLTYSQDAKLHNFINSLSIGDRHRRTMLLEQKSTQLKIVSKNLAKKTQLEHMTNFTMATILQSLRDEDRLDGLQFCPLSGCMRFVEFLQTNCSNYNIGNKIETIALYLLFGSEPVLLPCLQANEFPVPQTLSTCGFTTYQEFAGKPLQYYYGSGNFKQKLSMASQLLDAAVKFSYGFNGFRLYITDLNSDNIVYNEHDRKVYFVDLDTLYIVDSTKLLKANEVHQHNYIECNDCFAYDPKDICTSGLSDINLFLTCQLLREDLKKDRTKGFLYPIPPEFDNIKKSLLQMLDECVDCPLPDCLNRFTIANRLNAFIKNFIF